MCGKTIARLSRQSASFTFESVKEILQSELQINTKSDEGEFMPLDLKSERVGVIEGDDGIPQKPRGPAARAEHVREFCFEYVSKLKSSSDRVISLGECLRPWLTCNFVLRNASEDSIVEGAIMMLTRLPSCPIPLPDIFSGDLGYEICSHESSIDMHTRSHWEDLDVVKHVDRNTIRMALHLSILKPNMSDPDMSHSIPKLIMHLNNIVELIDTAYGLWTTAVGGHLRKSLVLLIAFTWTSWHRSLSLYFSYRLDLQLNFAYSGFTNDSVRGPSFTALPNCKSYDTDTSVYMCRCAYEVLRTDRSSIGMDFRMFHHRYNEYAYHHDHMEPRCILQDDRSPQQCTGRSIATCMRYKGQIVKDQSAHATTCTERAACAESRLYWDSASYKQVSGGRAVSITADVSKGLLQYCTATEKTLSVSHVWSHGQGGRPEHQDQDGTGFNRCLHHRYCKLARDHGCDSYWMDTPCIPSDHKLRDEAINEINNIFTNSKMTIVCDKDIMEIDISDLTLDLQERILSVLLVCDWNTRAWTFLEAMRGRQDLRLLCKDDKVVSVKDLLVTITNRGSLDLAMLFFTAQHLIPRRTDIQVAKMSGLALQRAKGFIGTEEAARLLSRRYATRTNDEVVIWSLLCSEDACHTPNQFWLKKRRSTTEAYKNFSEVSSIHSGFLVSSAPRLQNERGFGWAPTTPNPLLMPQDDGRLKAFYPRDGYGSAQCFIHEEGLRGHWLISSFKVSDKTSWWSALFRYTMPGLLEYDEFASVVAKHLKQYRYGAFLKPARTDEDYGPGVPRSYHLLGHDGGSLVVIVGTNNNITNGREIWTWVGVHEWPLSSTAPLFKRKCISIE